MNIVNWSWVGGEMRGRVGASGEIGALVGALLLLVLDSFAGPWVLASSSCSPKGSGRRLMQGLRQAQDTGAIATKLKSKERNVVLSNTLADLLDMELLEL